MPDPTATKSDFLAAEEIKGILEGREKAEQERIIRWVGESLELSITGRTRAHTQEAHATASAPPTLGEGDRSSRATDMRTWVAEKQPKSDTQFVAVVAYFFRFIGPEAERKDSITAEDLQTAARLAGWRVFKTPSVTLNNVINQGYLDRAGRGAYRLNAVGENLVTMTLPGTGESGAKRPRKKATRSGSKAKGSKAKKRAS